MIDEREFFQEATLRICGSLEIEKAMQRCLGYLRDFIPAGRMGFHMYHRDLGIVETVAGATPEKGELLSIKTPLNSRAREQIDAQRSIRVRLIHRLGDDAVTRPVARQLDAEDLSAVVMDLVLEKKFLGILSVFADGDRPFNGYHARLLSLLNGPFAIALTNSLRYRQLQQYRDMLADDNRYLQDELRRMAGAEVVGADLGLKGVMDMVRQVAPLNSPVLLLGETGTGKEVIAHAIHNLSLRREGPFIRVNCGAMPQTLVDSELFGHEKGAFTGALSQKRGRFERADGGTIFLDEVGELPLDAQIRLLRALQEREIERVGGTQTIRVNIRVIAATHRDLETMLSRGRFREDLYFRLRVFPIAIPPLRHRTEDIPALVQHFIQKKTREMKLARMPVLSPGGLNRLLGYRWPGNVRELENAVERSIILNRGGELSFDDLGQACPEPGAHRTDDVPIPTLDTVVSRHIREVLERCRGRIEGEAGAAKLLAVHPSTLRKRMKKLGIPYGRRTLKKLS